ENASGVIHVAGAGSSACARKKQTNAGDNNRGRIAFRVAARSGAQHDTSRQVVDRTRTWFAARPRIARGPARTFSPSGGVVRSPPTTATARALQSARHASETRNRRGARDSLADRPA